MQQFVINCSGEKTENSVKTKLKRRKLVLNDTVDSFTGKPRFFQLEVFAENWVNTNRALYNRAQKHKLFICTSSVSKTS